MEVQDRCALLCCSLLSLTVPAELARPVRGVQVQEVQEELKATAAHARQKQRNMCARRDTLPFFSGFS